MGLILVLDLGTTYIKCMLFNTKLEMEVEKRERIETQSPGPGYHEQSPEKIKIISEKLISEVTKASGVDSIELVVFTNAMHSIIPLDETDNPLNDAIIWSDQRSGYFVDQIKQARLDRQMYLDTGTPAHPMSPLYKIVWFKNKEPAIYSSTRRFASIKDYLILKWFGEFVTDYSTASASGMFNVNTLEWSNPALQLAGVSEEQLPNLESIYYNLRRSSNDFFTGIGIAKNTPILLGATDGCLALLGGGKKHRNDLSLSVGTSAAIRAASPKPIPDPDSGIFNYFLEEGLYITGGPSNNGGNLLDWLGKTISHGNTLNSEMFISDDLPKLMHETKAGADGMIFLPYIFGERAPIWENDTTGSFHGVTYRHHSGHFARAVVEGLFFNLMAISEILEKSTGPFQRIILSGGVFSISGMAQLVSNMFGREVCICGSNNLSAVGAAIVGWKHLGVGSVTEIEDSHVYTPDFKLAEFYKEGFEKFKRLLNNYKQISD